MHVQVEAPIKTTPEKGYLKIKTTPEKGSLKKKDHPRIKAIVELTTPDLGSFIGGTSGQLYQNQHKHSVRDLLEHRSLSQILILIHEVYTLLVTHP